jgi:predicted DNA-binding protein (MmcQ/YjbR family)
MDWDDVCTYCETLKGATRDYPFDAVTLVYKVMGKMFALPGSSPAQGEAGSVNLKCDPELAIILRQTYPKSVLPGYHMSKRHWNTIILDGTIPDDEIRDMIDESYHLVVSSLKKADRQSLGID